MEWFRIDWKGSYPIDTAQAKLGASGFGIYAIYEMKGKTTKLLYIGETYWKSFGKQSGVFDLIVGPQYLVHAGIPSPESEDDSPNEFPLDIQGQNRLYLY